MIAPWIFELLRREQDWRAALPKIATQLSQLPEDRIRAALDLGAAFEHIEPDRRHAISAYQLAGPGRDGGRSRALAVELGWHEAIARLGQLEVRAGFGVEPLIAACRALIDLRDVAGAQRLLDMAQLERAHLGDPSLSGVRAELDERHAEWEGWAAQARDLDGALAAQRLVIAARLARGAGRTDWSVHLEGALAAEPGNTVATAMLADAAFASKDRNAVIGMLRVVTPGLQPARYVDVLRAIATRLSFSGRARAGLSRRLLHGALDRAYTSGLTKIDGHLAMWHIIDNAARVDGRRTELLPLVMRGMDAGVAAPDRAWLAALGANVCTDAGDLTAARAYAAVVAEQAPSHPIVRDLLADTGTKIDEIELDAVTVVPVPDIAPIDDGMDVELAPWTPGRATESSAPTLGGPDPRFIDTRVRALDEDVENTAPKPRREAKQKPAPAANPTAAPNARPAIVDEAWEVDEQLFLPNRKPTDPPPTAAAVASPPPKPASPPKPVSPPASLIPAAALKVLQSAGAPRTLPKVVPERAIPRAPRVVVAVDVTLRHGNRDLDVHTRDFSASGFFAVTFATLTVGDVVDIEVRFPTPTGHEEQTFAARAKVVRKELAGYGLVLVEPPAAMVAAIAALTD
jgi:hypothetical protein